MLGSSGSERLPTSSSLTSSPAVATSASPLAGDDEEEPPTASRGFWHGVGRVFGAFLGSHGVLSHFPVLILGIIGVTMIMHRHWPSATKMLAGVTLGSALAIILIYALGKSDMHDAMFATRWFVVFLPLTLFWAGAWLRRGHRQSSWIMAGLLLAFSSAVSILGATGPLPRDGFDRYSVAGAWHNLFRHDTPPSLLASPLADRGGGDAIGE